MLSHDFAHFTLSDEVGQILSLSASGTRIVLLTLLWVGHLISPRWLEEKYSFSLQVMFMGDRSASTPHTAAAQVAFTVTKGATQHSAA